MTLSGYLTTAILARVGANSESRASSAAATEILKEQAFDLTPLDGDMVKLGENISTDPGRAGVPDTLGRLQLLQLASHAQKAAIALSPTSGAIANALTYVEENALNDFEVEVEDWSRKTGVEVSPGRSYHDFQRELTRVAREVHGGSVF